MTQIDYDKLPVVVDLEIVQGETCVACWLYEINNVGQDISSYTAKLEIRNGYGGTLYDTRETGGSGITLSTAGLITVTWASTVTDDFTFTRAIYDLKIINGTVVTVMSMGDVHITPRVSQ
jgi:hypothetical protein